ncbi:heterokaryon incompatibility (HET) domain-containing protein [Fusarium phyllophilum]|uniref:Heterokaryon incompatibility (HET) domain-containing protein n=1 Tax=Fusarium phyllophilum TaxID=47803 RepID=A0A8H5MMC2_9HYPO|nr:heterokaryon incompatibility (HET) domain-containing protein [Fusarium phyllophilum]
MANLSTPHWILDIEEWKLYEYAQLGREIDYGIVSYTWGMFRDPDQSAEGKPQNVRWDVPYVEDLPLDKARKVMRSMDMQYVWWDWMCVPQRSARNPLTAAEVQLAGQEIAKQMSIYKRAKASIVWLHRIEWDNHPLLGCYLAGSIRATNQIPFRSNIEALRYCVKRIQEEEPWLTSGWTLQEGVLLPNTRLLDKHGKSLKCGAFAGDDAVVSTISASINPLASRIAQAFMDISWREYSTSDPPPGIARILEFVSASPENREFIAIFLADLLRTGLVGYTNNAPLFILAGRVSRRFSAPEDHYWALLGAMEITVENPQYNDGREMGSVISTFFRALLEKHQWRLFVMAKMDQISEWDNRHWPERISEGHILPLEIYLGQVELCSDLPRVSIKQPHVLLIEPSKSKKPDETSKVTFIDKQQVLYTRRYRQSTYMDGFIHIDAVRKGHYTKSLFLPIANVAPLEDIDPRDRSTPRDQKVRKGLRCVEIEHLAESSGKFLGITDVWANKASEKGISVEKNLFRLVHFDYYMFF